MNIHWVRNKSTAHIDLKKAEGTMIREILWIILKNLCNNETNQIQVQLFIKISQGKEVVTGENPFSADMGVVQGLLL